MRKRIIGHGSRDVSAAEPGWLDLESLAQVEITSEAGSDSIESALIPGMGSGWQAAQPGEQTILLFHAGGPERTQEFVLRWSPDGGQSYREILRQQYNFSPGAAPEVEDYEIDLNGVTVLELRIVPDISGGSAHASLAQLRLA
jgi:hypothetical protein